MHGWLWSIHKTHHRPGKYFFEWNDLFSLFFGIIAIALIFSGIADWDTRFWAGAAIALYGIIYFVLHDIMVHGRIKWKYRSENPYLKALIRAHKMHHKHLEKNNSESFGLLWVARKYYK